MSGASNPSKRHKGDGGHPAPPGMGGPPPHDGFYGGYGRMTPNGGAPYQPSYGGPPPMGPPAGYMPHWQNGQYGGHPPHHGWGPGHAPTPPPGMYKGGAPPPMTPDRPGGYGGPPPGAYGRGPPPHATGRALATPPPTGPRGVRSKGPVSSSRPPSQAADPIGPDGRPAYPGGGWGGQSGGQWSQAQYAGGPPYPSSGTAPNAPASMPPPSFGGASTPTYSAVKTPPRPASRLRGSPDLMPSSYAGDAPSESYTPRGGADDDAASTATGRDTASKDKGRGSYKCGRCGVPKKGHICPYQPKVSRKPGDPLPELRSAAVQVEMDEFMTMRRLNLAIQGFPESYVSEPYRFDGDDIHCVGEAVHPPPAAPLMPSEKIDMMRSSSPRATPPIVNSPIRSSPVAPEVEDVMAATEAV